ncbi:putative transcription factor bHLH family [Helianthus annuus]|uniref:Putative myc-type, basic helix-loop-helix (BHLH) domain-containing protein n=1 Tax=Helianthus annuus TaxID=4232 RepID=A0A251S452_HELAN|nr:transcription factor bHLH115 [Helianthus annuus]KAF5760580.1 putative transcription factor bHLH family [Helianthus annuus]KAJ0443427.1 putative transcription factor bHLH family [Helianthus annuus]KAJ0821742.1 putative transcription factor bHLH family [Helianthus annuus]
MIAPEHDDNSSSFFDFSLIDQIPLPGGQLPSLDSDFLWSSDPFTGSTNISTEYLDSSCCKELGSRKRVNPASCSSTDTKACREKKRRDKMNERFQELNEILDPGRPPKTDKTVILGDAIRRVIQLREEAVKLKESTQDLQAKINELKVEKTELRDEKQKLKAEKERLEQQIKAFTRPPATSAFFPYPQSPIVDGKFVPFMGYHGVPMWPFASVPAVDTSEDHILRSPLA